MTVMEYSLKFIKLSRYATFLISNSRDEMRMFLIGISGDLEECQSAMLQDNMELSRLMIHVHQVENRHKKRCIRDAMRPEPQYKVGSRHGGHRNNFGVCEKPRFKKGQQSSGNSNSKKSTTPRRDRPDPKKHTAGEMQRPRKDYIKCGRAHSGKCKHGSNTCFDCGKSGHMVRDCP